MGGKGGPLAFLNKKPWHPGNLRNLERVWQKEQEHEREQKRLDELKKQIQEERQKEELDQIAHQSGKYKREERLEWLYQGGVAARQEADQRNEQQALKDQQAQINEQQTQLNAKVQEQSLLPSFYAQDTPTSALETWQRMNNDPLFLIKKKEQEALQKIRKNPVVMMRLKEEVAQKTEHSKKSKKEKKSKKKKEKKQKSKKRSRSVSVSLDEEEEEKLPQKQRRIDEQQKEQQERYDFNFEKQKQREEGYGLSYSRDLNYSRHQDTNKQTELTRSMLEQAAKQQEKQEREERVRYQERFNKSQYQTGRMKQEEIDRRRRAMQQNASFVERDRREVINEDEDEDILAQRDREQSSRDINSSRFIQQTQREFYGSGYRNNDGDNLTDRVARRRHYSQRNPGELE